jgi:hypothetical protein
MCKYTQSLDSSPGLDDFFWYTVVSWWLSFLQVNDWCAHFGQHRVRFIFCEIHNFLHAWQLILRYLHTLSCNRIVYLFNFWSVSFIFVSVLPSLLLITIFDGFKSHVIMYCNNFFMHFTASSLFLKFFYFITGVYYDLFLSLLFFFYEKSDKIKVLLTENINFTEFI